MLNKTVSLTMLRRAANLLRQDAKAQFDSCSGGKDAPWVCGGQQCQRNGKGKCPAQRSYEARMATAAALLK